MDKKELLTILLRDVRFNISGSRYFNRKAPEIIKVTSDTDWDFFADTKDPSVREFLEAYGFVETYNDKKDGINPDYKGDDLLDFIFEHEDYNIQVLLRKDIKSYIQVQTSIIPEFYRDYLWKSGPNAPQRDQIQAIYNSMFYTVINADLHRKLKEEDDLPF